MRLRELRFLLLPCNLIYLLIAAVTVVAIGWGFLR